MANGNSAISAFSSQSEVQLLPVGKIFYDQDVPKIRHRDTTDLLHSVHERGIDTPLIVRKIDSAEIEKPHGHKLYEIIDGKARWTCAVALGIDTVPAIVVQMSYVEARRYREKLAREKPLQRIFGVALDQPTDALLEIAGLMERQRELNLEIGELDRIADGVAVEDDSILACKGFWFDGFLENLSWWKTVSEILLGSKDVDHKFFPEPAFAHHQEALLKLVNDTLAAFAPAWQEGSEFSSDWTERGEATRELLKRYRTFTRYVCTFAQEVWPDVSMGPLLKRA